MVSAQVDRYIHQYSSLCLLPLGSMNRLKTEKIYGKADDPA